MPSLHCSRPSIGDQRRKIGLVASSGRMPERKASGLVIVATAGGGMVHGDLRRAEAGEHDVLPCKRIRIDGEVAPKIFKRPIPPDPMVGLLVDKPTLGVLEIAAERGQARSLRHRQRIAYKIQLVAYCGGLGLIDPLETVKVRSGCKARSSRKRMSFRSRSDNSPPIVTFELVEIQTRSPGPLSAKYSLASCPPPMLRYGVA